MVRKDLFSGTPRTPRALPVQLRGLVVRKDLLSGTPRTPRLPAFRPSDTASGGQLLLPYGGVIVLLALGILISV